MQYFAAFGGEEELRKTFGGTEGNGGWREASTGWREASAEPKLTEKAEPELTLKEETEFLRN
jgi:hypothetical protein